MSIQGALISAVVSLCIAGCATVDEKTLSQLPPERAKQLKVWSTNHSVVFDLRIHSIDTCPFLAYLPAAVSLHGQEWAEFAYNFYSHKHIEEDHCTCDAELGSPEKQDSPMPEEGGSGTTKGTRQKPE